VSCLTLSSADASIPLPSCEGIEGLSGMPGDRFSRLYVQTRELTPDSDRARYRIAALFRETIFKEHAERLAVYNRLMLLKKSVACQRRAIIESSGPSF
jgi:hypothetical protein